MKQLLVFLSLVFLSVSRLDYQTPANSWNFPTCTRRTTATGFQSPIDMSGSACKPYENFEISATSFTLPAFTFDQTMGAFKASWTSLSLLVNSKRYTSTDVILRTHSEHIVSSLGTGALELQIKLSGPSSSIGFLSFVIRERENNKAYSQIPNNFVTVTSSVSVDMQGIVNQINENLSQGNFLNLLTYEGTQTYPEGDACPEVTWFVYGTELMAEASTISAYQTLLGSESIELKDGKFNSRLTTGEYGGDGKHFVMRLCFTGYFRTTMNENYGLWFGVVITLFWFIFNLVMGDKPIKDADYHENVWTHHPLISVYTVGNEIFSRKQRLSLLLATITVHALFTSTWYRRSEHKTRDSNLIVFAVYSMLINWVITAMIGAMLRGYTKAKNQYYKTREDAWDQKAQNRLFAFYFSIFIVIVVGWPFTVWNMGELHPEIDNKPSDFWVASFFIGLGLELLIADPIVCFLGKKIAFVKHYMRIKGYFYDNLTHDTYLSSLKFD